MMTLQERCKKEMKNFGLISNKGKTRNCTICGRVINAIEITKGVFVLPKCKCETDKADEEEKRRQIEEKQRQANDAIAIAGMGKRIQKCTFDNYRVNKDNKEIFEKCQKYAGAFKKFYKVGVGLLLTGTTGNGKTHLSAAILKSVIRQGFTALFVVVADLLVEKRMSKRGDLDGYMKHLQGVDLLILDDLGRNEMKDFDISFIFSVINSRVNNEKPTIITSNMLPAEWEAKDHGRVYSRLKQTSKIIINTAKDERGCSFL